MLGRQRDLAAEVGVGHPCRHRRRFWISRSCCMAFRDCIESCASCKECMSCRLSAGGSISPRIRRGRRTWLVFSGAVPVPSLFWQRPGLPGESAVLGDAAGAPAFEEIGKFPNPRWIHCDWPLLQTPTFYHRVRACFWQQLLCPSAGPNSKRPTVRNTAATRSMGHGAKTRARDGATGATSSYIVRDE